MSNTQNQPAQAGQVERRVMHLLPCKNCGDSDPENALFGARPEFIPGISLGWYVHCKVCGELSKSQGDSYEQFISAWNKRHNAELTRAQLDAEQNRDASGRRVE